MHFASAADHTSVFLHSYPIKQIKLGDSGNHLINFYRVWWQGKVELGVRIVLLVRQNGLDRDKISSIALNSSGPTRQGQKYVLAKGENVITNSSHTACVFVWLCVHGLQPFSERTRTHAKPKQGKNPLRGVSFSHFSVHLHLSVALTSVSAELHMSPLAVQSLLGCMWITSEQQIQDPQEHKTLDEWGTDHSTSVWVCSKLDWKGIRRICWVKKKYTINFLKKNLCLSNSL